MTLWDAPRFTTVLPITRIVRFPLTTYLTEHQEDFEFTLYSCQGRMPACPRGRIAWREPLHLRCKCRGESLPEGLETLRFAQSDINLRDFPAIILSVESVLSVYS